MATKKKAAKGALIYLVLDKSGSMSAIAQPTIDGVNLFTRETAAADPNALYSQIQFDTTIRKVYSGMPIADIERLDSLSYRPGGNTALLDAIGHAVKSVDEIPDRPEKVVIVIMTDGMENSSREYTRAAVQELVAAREKEGWQFLYLGANVDAFAEAGSIGMAAAASSSATYVPSASGTQAAYMASSRSTSDYLTGATRSATLTQDSYNQTLSEVESKTAEGLNAVDAAAKAAVAKKAAPDKK